MNQRNAYMFLNLNSNASNDPRQPHNTTPGNLYYDRIDTYLHQGIYRLNFYLHHGRRYHRNNALFTWTLVEREVRPSNCQEVNQESIKDP